MYYLVELKQDNQLKIVKNVIKEGLKIVALTQILKADNISLVENDYQLDKAGLYCVECGNDTYRLFRYITEADGYLFYGARYEVDVAFYKFVYYVNELDNIDGVSEQLKQLGLKDKIEEQERQERVRKQRLTDMAPKIETMDENKNG